MKFKPEGGVTLHDTIRPKCVYMVSMYIHVTIFAFHMEPGILHSDYFIDYNSFVLQ